MTDVKVEAPAPNKGIDSIVRCVVKSDVAVRNCKLLLCRREVRHVAVNSFYCMCLKFVTASNNAEIIGDYKIMSMSMAIVARV